MWRDGSQNLLKFIILLYYKMGMLDVAMSLVNRPDRNIRLHGQNHIEKMQDMPIKIVNPVIRDRVRMQ
jgi:hypothetical protein